IAKRQRMMELLFTATGSKIDNQINLIGTDGTFVEYGRTFDISLQSVDALAAAPWIAECLALEGKMYISAPHLYNWNTSGDRVVSVCRAFNETFGGRYNGFVEILTDYDVFAQAVEAAVRPEGIRAFVYDSGGHQIYPLPETSGDTPYFSYTQQSSLGTFPLTAEGRNEIVAFSRSAYTGITMVMCEDEAQLLAPVADFRNRLIGAGVITLVITSLMTLLLANQLTVPIRNIQKSINKLNLSDLHSDEVSPLKNSAYELTTLNHAYSKMVSRLQASLDETVTARSHEVEARMLALQAQMNPHFLYNTITVISIKAEDSGDEKVVKMCESLSSMLRYIAKEAPACVPLRDELAHLRQYLYLMECRYPDRFAVELSVPPEMETLQIPKLTIQPLVENCFKHAFQARSPWKISITGSCDAACWRVCVTDNGVGFSAEALAQFTRTFYRSEGDFSESDFGDAARDKIGLGNIFHRLKYRYRERAVFQIENLEGAGCRITIGGTKKEREPHDL
ncbi:MAG: histidine kinase, partial [Ruthenibacterium sp.]